MQCPFELPVKKDNIFILDKEDDIVAMIEHLDEADYIVQAINSHEKLIKIKQISYEAVCTGDQEASDKAIGLIEDFEQALKEAEKE